MAPHRADRAAVDSLSFANTAWTETIERTGVSCSSPAIAGDSELVGTASQRHA
jgi:hypothetical protein